MSNKASYIYLTAAAWTILVFILADHQVLHIRSDTQEMAINEAQTHFKKDQALRHWVSSHGGVYVPVDEHTEPNEYLSHVQERDIETPLGRQLTLMNPAYVIRQMSGLYAELYGVGGHITSLNLLQPKNEADDWEKKALMVFEQGKSEFKEFTDIDGTPFLRYMESMIAQKPCLKCHSHQGYKEGDVRGGVSVSIPMTAYYANERHEILMHLLFFGLLWFAGLSIIGLGGLKLLRSMNERNRINEELLRHKEQLEEVVEKRTEELTEANEKLKYLSLTDGLTSIANRRYFDELLQTEWQRAMREARPLALVMIDIDYFKPYNDTYGHIAGDECLKKVAMTLNIEMKRAGDFVARFGGEEFAAVLPHTDATGALAIAEKMSSGVASLQIEHAGSETSDHVTISLGITSVIPERDAKVIGLIQQADKALYAAKENGRNQIKLFSNDI